MSKKADVQIRPIDGGYSILVGGHELNEYIAADGVGVQFDSDASGRPVPIITLTLGEGVTLDADLADALVSIAEVPR